MTIQIQILNVTIETKPTTKGSYQKAEVAYKNLSFQGKVEGKGVMSFGATAETFKVLATAQAGEIYDVQTIKNDKGYLDWVKMTKADIGSAQAVPQYAPNPPGGKSNATAARSTYETPEERAIKQVYIVKQSSVSNAIATLSVGAKSVKPEDVLALAQKYTDFVFGKGVSQGGAGATPQGGATGFDDVPEFDPDFKPE
jgi:hypothetical protein